MNKKESIIKVMPDQETLEAFIKQMHGEPMSVVFNTEKGEFEWVKESSVKVEVVSENK